LLLALLRAASQQNDKPVAVPPEVNAVTGAKINPVFENATTGCLDVGQLPAAMRSSAVATFAAA
jgi:hypothetical protein